MRGPAIVFLVVTGLSCLNPPATVEPAAFPTDVTGCTPPSSDVAAASLCLEAAGPEACMPSGGCDADEDGIPDAMERSLAGAYAPVFAFNSGVGGGIREPAWPANVAHFVAYANLTWRGDGFPDAVIMDSVTLDELGFVGARVDGKDVRADDPALGAGSDFWLCMNETGNEVRVGSAEAMLRLEDGVDVYTVVRPANGTLAESDHIAISFVLLFPYNPFELVGDHEGDWEGITIFVEKRSGEVQAAWFERHGTTDNLKLVTLAGHGAKDPLSDDTAHGLRFWDAQAHRLIAYVSQGSHAMFDGPGETRVYPPGPSDSHMGDGKKLLTWNGQLVEFFGAEDGDDVKVNLVLPGEASHITLPWARYRGQWGCQDGLLGKSWPGPFGNARHPRPMFERKWGNPPSAPED